ncbi:MAG: transglutaminase, partial [Deltaproteobacteria bacterium]|nr:transglutaminase [Deltaproteobacteria bacterium]
MQNSGSASLTITNVTLAGSNPGRFQILGGGGSGTVSAGSHRDIDVRYLANAIGTHDAVVRIDFEYDGLASQIDLPLAGETLSTPLAQLWLDDELIAQETTPGSDPGVMTLSIDHPYSADGGTYGDQTSTYNLKRGSTYVIVSDFGGSGTGRLLKSRQRILDAYRDSGLSDTSRQVLCETLNIMGQTWMEETTLNTSLLSQLSGVISIRHHRFGITAQEAGYYVDVKTQLVSNISRHTGTSAADACFRAENHLMSAMEHGVLEQLQVNRPAASTVKLLQIANAQGDKVFWVDADNYAAIEPQLSGYSAQDKQTFQTRVMDDGQTLILPADGQLVLEQWQGKGYIEFGPSPGGTTHVGMIIGGDYYGGYAAFMGNADPEDVVNDFHPELKDPAEVARPKSKEPVDMVTGAYLFEHEDLSMGGAEPLGLHFKRFYSSNNRNQEFTLRHGWTHNYDVYVSIHSDAESGLGLRQPVDAAALITASMATLELMADEPDIKDWMTSSLIAKWAMDQLTDNGASVHVASDVLTYIKLPDGSYSAPPGVTAKLVKRSNGQFRLKKRFGILIDFNADDKISSWQDADGNTMTFTYNANGKKLLRVEDAFGRTLNLGYTNGKITSVSDSAGRSVSYGYGDQNLIRYTDPEGNKWRYGYDSGHRMTSLTDPLDIVTATNTYDALGRVATQTVPRQGGGSATYNFYFSDFRNIEEDPDGNQTIYYLDDKGRTIGQEDPLGHKSAMAYDGQNHVIERTDPRLNTTSFVYDGNHNLIKTIDALTYETTNTYDAQFRLTGVTDPLGHRTHFAYDANHHLITTKVYPETGQTIKTSATYNHPNGLKDTSTDGRGTVTTMTYDAYGNPDTTTVGAHPAVDYTYDPIGRMISLTDQVGSETTFVYDDRGLLESITDPLDSTTSFTYYDDGRLYTKTDRNNDTITYTYTPSGKTDTITYPDSSTVAFTYDIRDNLVQMDDWIGTTTYIYDEADRLISMTDPHGFVVSYQYDEANNITQITYPGNKTVSYTYDALNRLE